MFECGVPQTPLLRLTISTPSRSDAGQSIYLLILPSSSSHTHLFQGRGKKEMPGSFITTSLTHCLFVRCECLWEQFQILYTCLPTWEAVLSSTPKRHLIWSYPSPNIYSISLFLPGSNHLLDLQTCFLATQAEHGVREIAQHSLVWGIELTCIFTVLHTHTHHFMSSRSLLGYYVSFEELEVMSM